MCIRDRGYFKGEEIVACHEAGIVVIVPKTSTSGAKADGRLSLIHISEPTRPY